jgi:hypothetical protein
MNADQIIYNQSIADGMPSEFAKLIVAQARFETNNYQSSSFINCNNCFGYKYVGQNLSTGPCLKSTENDYYAGYSTIQDSTHELTQWIKRRQNDGSFPDNLSSITSPAQYANLLKSAGYYGGPVQDYNNGLAYWVNQLPALQYSALNTFFLIIFGGLLMAFRKKLFKK